MARIMSEAERLHHCSEVFQRAIRDGVDMSEAKKRIMLDGVADRQARIAALRGKQGFVTVDEFAFEGEAKEPRFYWQRGDLA
ncbi:MAG: hypothetical protein EOP62_14215 [Sphingomonadales bacterium]|nr:MAG: hypothetical protein EOP62_14215 [Sphingomonadales bacterium]